MADATVPIRMLAGLGNPGRQYADTRHNVGWMILDRFAAQAGARFSQEKRWKCEIARAGDLWLVKPQTYMNLSGEAVGAVAAFYRLPPEACLAVYDDKDLPFGVLRLREGGSAGGHNGVKSLISHLGTQQFPRLRFGIGTTTTESPTTAAVDSSSARSGDPGRAGTIGFVLGSFSPEERARLEKRLDRAVEALNYAARHGFPKAMNHFNRPDPDSPTAPPPPPKPPPTSAAPPTT